MSIWSVDGNIKLGELIELLESRDPDEVWAEGLGEAHSYRGYYEDIAFEPAQNVTVREMLAEAKGAIGKTFNGYKGGKFEMDENTDVWRARYGSIGMPVVVAPKACFIIPEGEAES